MKTSKIIQKLQHLMDENGDQEFTIYKSFDKVTTEVRENDIHFDEEEKDIYIAIYN